MVHALFSPAYLQEITILLQAPIMLQSWFEDSKNEKNIMQSFHLFQGYEKSYKLEWQFGSL